MSTWTFAKTLARKKNSFAISEKNFSRDCSLHTQRLPQRKPLSWTFCSTLMYYRSRVQYPRLHHGNILNDWWWLSWLHFLNAPVTYKCTRELGSKQKPAPRVASNNPNPKPFWKDDETIRCQKPRRHHLVRPIRFVIAIDCLMMFLEYNPGLWLNSKWWMRLSKAGKQQWDRCHSGSDILSNFVQCREESFFTFATVQIANVWGPWYFEAKQREKQL